MMSVFPAGIEFLMPRDVPPEVGNVAKLLRNVVHEFEHGRCVSGGVDLELEELLVDVVRDVSNLRPSSANGILLVLLLEALHESKKSFDDILTNFDMT